MSDELEISDEILMAYSDGELSPEEEQRIEGKLADNEELRERLAIFVDTRRFLKSEYLKVKSEGVPDRFKSIIQSSAQRRTSRLQEFFNSLFTMKVATSAAFSLVLGITLGVALTPTIYQAPPGNGELRSSPKVKEEKIWINVDGVRKQVVVKQSFTIGSYVDCQVVQIESDPADTYIIRCDDARDNTVKTMTIR